MKPNLYTLLLAAALTLANATTVNAQTNTWQTLAADQNVELQYLHSYCIGAEVLILKLVNGNSQSVTVTWQLWQNETPHTLTLQASEELEGDCLETSPPALHKFIPPGLTTNDLSPTAMLDVHLLSRVNCDFSSSSSIQL